MRRLLALPGTLAFAAVLGGCGADAHEEAPVVATGEVIAQAPPNAVGADIERPAAPPPKPATTKGGIPVPTGHAKPPGLGAEPVDPAPTPGPGDKQQKGPDL